MKRTIASIAFILFVIACFSGAASAFPPVPGSAIPVTPKAPVFTEKERLAELSRRRAAVADRMEDNSILILLSAEPKIYTNDVDYPYRQENNLFYLTMIPQNGAQLVMVKDKGKVSEHLFLPKRNPQFETWNGRMLSNREASEISGIADVIDMDRWEGFLDDLKQKRGFRFENSSMRIPDVPDKIYLLLGKDEREFGRERKLAKELAGYKTVNAAPMFAEMRLVKSPYEIKLLQHAIDITAEAVGRSMGMARNARWEYEVQAEVEYTFRRRNADFWGYPSIVGCGPNATTLHYEEAQGRVKRGELLLMDVGAEYAHYTADITRTFPVNGKFSREQADIYRIVYKAQEAAASTIRPGVEFKVPGGAARDVIEEGLLKLGLITAKGATYDAEFNGRTFKAPQYRLWFMHGWGHWIGMNVHDVGPYGVFKEGMVTTNEPGIYIRADALDYLPDTPENAKFRKAVQARFKKYKNIGVRIEDDLLVTKDGVEWMSRALPRSLKDVEAFIRKASAEMKGR